MIIITGISINISMECIDPFMRSTRFETTGSEADKNPSIQPYKLLCLWITPHGKVRPQPSDTFIGPIITAPLTRPPGPVLPGNSRL